jgi:hypothetical protein
MSMPELTQHQYWALDIIVKSILLIAGIWAVYKYKDTVHREFRKPLWDKQIEVYSDICEIAATLATVHHKTSEYSQARERFLRLYYGLSILVDDNIVEERLLEFRKLLHSDDRRRRDLRAACVDLTEACRVSLTQSWQTRLSSYTERYGPETRPNRIGRSRRTREVDAEPNNEVTQPPESGA